MCGSSRRCQGRFATLRVCLAAALDTAAATRGLAAIRMVAQAAVDWLGWMDWSVIRYGVAGYIGLVILMILFTGPLVRRAAESNEAIYLAPLGL